MDDVIDDVIDDAINSLIGTSKRGVLQVGRVPPEGSQRSPLAYPIHDPLDDIDWPNDPRGGRDPKLDAGRHTKEDTPLPTGGREREKKRKTR